MLPGDASAAGLNGCIVFGVSSACMQQWWGGGLTYVTAYCAKDRYSTNTSRPLLSSFKNSLTHLETQKASLITQELFEQYGNVSEKHLEARSMP